MANQKWVSFRNREGPVAHGVHEYSLPDAPTERDIYVAAAVACEHGSYDDVNMYDRGIVSMGLFQWIEAGYGGVSTLLGLLCASGLADHVQKCLEPALNASNAKFVRGTTKWQFYQNGKPVDTLDGQKLLFLGCEGSIGTWTPEARGRAVTWAKCLASIWDDPRAREVQRKFANERVMQYVFKTAKVTLFAPEAPKTPMANALRAVYIALAINAPGTADSIIKEAVRANRLVEWSDEWCTSMLRALATTKLLPNFAKRYETARAVAERAYGVQLPMSFSDVFVQKPVTVTHTVGPARRVRLNTTSAKIIELDEVEIAVPVPKKSIVDRFLGIFKK